MPHAPTDDATRIPTPDSPAPDHASAFWHARRSLESRLGPIEPGAIDASEFALLADNIPTPCWIARGDGYIVWYNTRWHQYCGTTPEAMEGWGWQDVHDPAELPRVMARWTASIESGGPFEMTFPLRGADGVFRPFLTRISPLRDASGEIVRWFGVNTEVAAQVRAESALDASEAKFTTLTDAMPQMVWSTLPDGYHDYYNQQWYDFTGVPAGSTDGEGWNGIFHPDDQPRAWERWRHSLATGEPYEIEYRLRHRDGHYRWTLGRALAVRDEGGQIIRWIGTCTDIHATKMAAEQNEILTHELSHRIKNIFAIIGSLIRLSLRRDPAAKDFARDLLSRIQSLGRAHEFARPHSENSQPTIVETKLQGLLTGLFLPYRDGDHPRIRVRGGHVEIDDKGATPMALLFHELATNAVKYGALSVPDGVVDLDITENGDDITMIWRESGGPIVSGPPMHQGFGTKLATMSIEQQLGGTFTRHWEPSGLVAIVAIKHTQLVRQRKA